MAARAGVSKSTVSLVLQSSPLVKAATRELVQRAMQDLGYVYNAAAAGLRAATAPAAPQTSGPMAALSCDLTHPAEAAFAAALQSAAAARGMGLALLTKGASNNAPWQGRKITTRLAEANDPATLFALHPLAPARLQESMAAQTATRHLLGLGASPVAFIGGDTAAPLHQQRLAGYQARMKQAGLDPLHIAGGQDYAQGRAAIDILLTQHPNCKAALCLNDDVALGVMAGLAARGIALGDAFRVVGWGDTPASAAMGLSSLRPDLPALAEACLSWLCDGGAGGCDIPLSLIRRRSSMGGA